MIPHDKLAPLYRSWLNSAMPKRQGPELGKVQSSTCSAQEYTCAVKLLEPDSLAETGTELSGVSINPLWADSHGSGIYAPPENGQIVVISYLGMDRNHPFVSAIWGGQAPNLRPSCPAAAGELLLVKKSPAGQTCIKFDSAGLLAVGNQNESLKALLTDLINDLSQIVVTGQASVDPSYGPRIQAYQARVAALFAD